jgi:hypothetical protein
MPPPRPFVVTATSPIEGSSGFSEVGSEPAQGDVTDAGLGRDSEASPYGRVDGWKAPFQHLVDSLVVGWRRA